MTGIYATTRFGEIEVAESEVLYLPEGLLGFQSLTRYTLIKAPEQEPFLWLQSLEDANLAFVVVDPFIFFPGFDIQVKAHELSTIRLRDVSQATVLTIVTIPQDKPMDLTTNLRGPLVLNIEEKLGKQLVLIDDNFHTKHYLLRDIPPYLAAPPTQPVNDLGKNKPDDAD